MREQARSVFFENVDVYKIYGLGSSAISVVLVPILSPHFALSLEMAFFPFLFVVGHFEFFRFQGCLEASGFGLEQQKSSYSSLFLFQILCLMSMSFHLEIFDVLYLGFVPCLAAALHYMTPVAQSSREKGLAKLAQLSLIVFLSLVIFQSLRQGLGSLVEREGLVFLTFMSWVGVLFYAVHQGLTFDHTDERDRFFYHDMINQTHGLLLFLKQEYAKGRGVTPDDQLRIIQEVETMQNLLSDHFKLDHKNIKSENEFKSFEQVKSSLFALMNHYLLSQQVSTHLVFKGLIDEERPISQRLECLVHFPIFYRIMNNLIKNSYEHKVSEVEIIFDYQETGLFLTMKNPLQKQVDDMAPLEKALGHLILHDTESSSVTSHQKQGLGLESVAALAESVGGSFQCCIEEGHWINQVFLPAPKSQSSFEGEKWAA